MGNRIRALASGLASQDDACANLVSAAASPDVTLEVILTTRRNPAGVSPRARALRSDRSTARMGDVLAGDLDLFLDPTS